MSYWTTVNLLDVNPNLEILPAKSFTFEILPGAKYDDRDPDVIALQVAVAADSEFSGRRIFLNYKPGEEKALKRLEQAVGIDSEENEDPVAYLNRAAGGRFNTSIKHSLPNDQYPNPKAFLQKWSVSPAV